MKIHDVPQLSREWFELRRGRPTASQFGRILTPKTAKLAAAADGYIAELIAEIFHLGTISELESTPSRAMIHGTDCEPEARKFYEMDRSVDVKQVGFCTTDDGRFGCSPDGLVGDDGILELKCPTGKTQVEYLLDGELPAEYRGQVHGALIVTGRAWVDFLSYCPGLPPLLIRQTRNSWTEALETALDGFWARFQECLRKIEGA